MRMSVARRAPPAEDPRSIGPGSRPQICVLSAASTQYCTGNIDSQSKPAELNGPTRYQHLGRPYTLGVGPERQLDPSSLALVCDKAQDAYSSCGERSHTNHAGLVLVRSADLCGDVFSRPGDTVRPRNGLGCTGLDLPFRRLFVRVCAELVRASTLIATL